MVTHGPPGDTFWDLIRKGAETAAKKDNIDLKYSAELAAPDQANLVQNAIDSKVAGIAITMAKPDAVQPAAQRAVEAGIPVVAFNAGIDAWKAAGVKAYFGQDERISGEAAGKRLATEGARKVVCVIQDQGNVALESRCAGVRSGFGGVVENLNVNGTDMPSVQSTITAKLQQDPSIDYIVALGAPSRLPPFSPPTAQAARPRSAPSTPTPNSSTRSRRGRSSGRSTSSRSSRATWRSTRCGCISIIATPSAAANRY
jgi:simple sugar transport system substrate-binding protein